jgi:acetyltransferase-like isoleucine patch superfamily enzyme
MKQRLRRALRMQPEWSFGFMAMDFLFRRILRQNAGVPFPVHHTSTIRTPDQLRVGQGTFPGDSPGVYINADNGIEIGDFTNLGPNVGLISANHDSIDNTVRVSAESIRIGKFCWLGMGAIVLPEVQLGDFTIVGAGSVVTKSFPEGYCVIAGNPARVLRLLNRDDCDKQATARYRTNPR